MWNSHTSIFPNTHEYKQQEWNKTKKKGPEERSKYGRSKAQIKKILTPNHSLDLLHPKAVDEFAK